MTQGASTESPFSVGRTVRATFVDRPNRFVVRCRSETGGVVRAHLPNPGRLWELLLPDAPLILVEPKCADAPKRKTRYTVVAVERDGDPVFLHTHWNNAVARHLIERGQIDGLRGAKIVRAETKVGRSRFDFLLRRRGRDVYLEVKSCTLFGNGVAIFPDAVTERGRRHLLELQELTKTGARSMVLFLVHTRQARWFMPDYHTDLAFSRTLLDVRKQVRVMPVAVGWTPILELDGTVRPIEIPWAHIRREARDGGSYLLILRLDRARRIAVGSLGALRFERGYYIYVGSAVRNLDARMARHVRMRKTLRWHIDYLRQHAREYTALPIRSSTRDEHAIAEALADAFEPGPPGFGASDSPCPTHLFRTDRHPLEIPAFHVILQRFRMRQPKEIHT